MKIEVVKAYGSWPVGHVFESMAPNQAAALIARGLVREVDEKAIDGSTFDRMMRARVKKGG